MLEEFKPVKVRVIKKGNVKINSAIVYKESPDIVLIMIDFKEKYVQSQGSGYDGKNSTYHVSANEDDQLDAWKIFYFPEYNDWKYFSSHISRYTMFIALTRKEPE